MSHTSTDKPGSLDDQPTATTLSQVDPQSPLSLVCSACRAGPFSYEGFHEAVKISHRDADETTGYRYITTWSEISQSINETCNWCRIVRRTRDGLPADKFPPVGEESVEVRFQVSAKRRWGSNVRIYLNGYKAATYDIYANPEDCAAEEIGTNAPKKYFIDYPRVLKCIKQCSNHKYCSTIEETYLPTRVIDCLDPSRPRLVDTQRKMRSYYCALSYVWGGEQAQKTTTSNIDAYVREGINIPLPQTIADAIFVTNKLGIRYLWVDALCIIQDSSEDKDKELGIMALVYRNAFLTISAQSALRADHGFLLDGRESHVLPFHLADRSMPPGRMLLTYRIPQPAPDWVIPPLDERGWCLQESLLSPRRLIFEPSRLAYKCRSFEEWDLTRALSKRSARPANDHILFPTTTNKNHNSTSTAGKVDEEALQDQWQEILWNYSRRKITVPSDKFVALASMVQAFQSISDDQYVAGLWRRTLLRDLLWQVMPYTIHLPRPLGYRAPTWSWASVDGELHFENFPRDLTSYEAEILVCDVIPKISTLPFGEITEARLTLKAKMHPLNCGGQEVGEIRFDCLEGTEEHPRMQLYLIILCTGRGRDYRVEERHDIIVEWQNWMQGLIVLPIKEETEQYRRVAKWSYRCKSQLPDWFDAMPLKNVTLI